MGCSRLSNEQLAQLAQQALDALLQQAASAPEQEEALCLLLSAAHGRLRTLAGDGFMRGWLAHALQDAAGNQAVIRLGALRREVADDRP